MERTEPALVPEWLRCSGSIAGGGASVHHSDVSSSVHSSRSRYFRTNNEKDSPRFLDRSSSSNTRRSSSSNGSVKHAYSSFTRGHRDKNRDREKEKSISDDIWDNDSSDPLAIILASRTDRSVLKRSQSLVSRKPGEVLSRRVDDFKSSVNSQSSGNGVLAGGSNLSGVQKATFEKDFPSLGAEEKQGVAGIRRVSSPVLNSAVQSLPIANTGFRGGEKWTSALAEVPVIAANNGTNHPLLQPNTTASSTSASVPPSTTVLNMAEALSQPPARARASPQLPDKTQRLEELAIKQSRQLIPMTPTMPKPLVPSSADKGKQAKIAGRTNEMVVPVASRIVQPQPHSSHLSNQSRAGQTRADSPSATHVGKFLVLKPGRENGVIVGTKDSSSPTDDANGKVSSGQPAVAPPVPTSSMSLSNSMVSALENKAAALSLSSRPNVEKRSFQFLGQSRSEFFNLMKRKTSSCAITNDRESSSPVPSPSSEPSGEIFKEAHAPVDTHSSENGCQMTCNGAARDATVKTEDKLFGNGTIYPDEEEAAFLRSLGWEENGGEDEGLTEEEINAFYQEYMNKRPSLNISGSSQLKCLAKVESRNASSSTIACSESSSSESDSES